MNNIFTHCDLYQLNMAYSYFKCNKHEEISTFEVYFRHRKNEGHSVFTGLNRIVEVIQNFKLNENEIRYLKKNLNFDQEFIDYLSNISFTIDLYSVAEGEVVFFNEPLMIIKGKLIEVQILETVILNIINYQTLISTQASKIKQSISSKQKILEFGARRAYELDAAKFAARSAYIGGFDATSLVSAGVEFDIDTVGTHAHSFVQSFESEYEAFKSYALTHTNVVFLLDTYDVLNSGIINAIEVYKKYKSKFNFVGVRLDSGDLAYLSKEVRKILDNNELFDVKIIASNDLDAQTILDLQLQEAKIDIYGIGTKLVSSYGQPSLGCVYKLVKINDRDVMKISNNVEKNTVPGDKELYRMFDEMLKVYKGDVICESGFKPISSEITLYNQFNEQYEKSLTNIKFINLHKKIFENGSLIYKLKNVHESKKYCNDVKEMFWPEMLRYNNPQTYYVSYENKLIEKKNKLRKKVNNAK